MASVTALRLTLTILPMSSTPPALPPEMLALKPMAGAPLVQVLFVESPDVTVSPVWLLMASPLCRHATHRLGGAEQHQCGDGGEDPEDP
jgi:hypothetical protein